MPKVVLELDEDDLEALTMAAEVAERPLEEFIAEEILSIADLINVQGNLKHVTLARHRDAENAQFNQSFNSSGRAQGPIGDWARKQGDDS